MSGIHYLKQFDISQFWRFFVDGRFQKKYEGWIGYEGGERGSVQALLNGFSFMLDNFDLSNGLKATYLRELHKICMLSVETTNLKSSPGDIRYLNSGMPFFAKSTTYEHLVEVFELRKGDGTAIFNSSVWGKPADELDVDEIYKVMLKDGKINYRNWYPNLDKKQIDALDGKLTLHEFYEAKHSVQMLIVSKMEEIVNRYNTNIKKAKTDEEKLKVISLVPRELELLHPFPDGNSRTFSCVTLTHLLLFNGFAPAILENPNLDNEVSHLQWIEEVKKGMNRTKELIKNPEMSLFNYSILDMDSQKREEFSKMASNLKNKIDSFKEIFLTSKKVENYTNGTWLTYTNDNLTFTGVGTYGTYDNGNIYFTMAINDWIKENKNPITELTNILNKRDIKALVFDDPKYIEHFEHLPILLVDNCFEAFKKCAINVRQELNPYTVLVTGTEGKTGAKVMFHHILNKQVKTHAVINSANTEIPVLRSLINLEPDDKIEINEVSVGSDEAYRVERTMMVNPNLCFFTNIGPNHMDMHKTLRNIMIAKSSVVEGLRDGGKCIVNSNIDHLDMLIEEIHNRKPNVEIISYGISDKDNARLIEQKFNTEQFGWDVKADIEGIKLEYFVPLIQKHSPLATVGILLAIKEMGYDVKKAANDFKNLEPFETMGRVITIPKKSGDVFFYDQSRRGAISGVKSAFEDLNNFKVSGRIIALVGGISVKKDNDWTKEAHKELANLINKSNIDVLYTTGNFMDYVHKDLKNPDILKGHEDDINKLANTLYSEIKGGDLLFIIGSAYLYLGRVSDKLLKMKDTDTFDYSINNYMLDSKDIEQYKALQVFSKIKNNSIRRDVFIENQISQEDFKIYFDKYKTYTNLRGNLLFNFFTSLDELMINSNFKVVNESIKNSNYSRYIYDIESCTHWFNNIDNIENLPKKQLFGTFYDFGNKKFLLHIEVATTNLHIGFVSYTKKNKTYTIKKMTEEEQNSASKFVKSLNTELPFEIRTWGLKWCSVDCGKIIDLRIAQNYVTLTNIKKSSLYESFLKPILEII